MSALTSLLARDQAVPVRKIEEALQRQVITGGDIGSVLLETDAIAENTLAAYHAALYGLLPATRDEVMRVSRDTIRLVPREVAEKHRLVPLAVDGRALVVAMSVPLDHDVESQLGFLLGYDLVIRIVCEVRISGALLHHYGVEPPARHRRLIEALRHRDAGPVPYVAPPEHGKLDLAQRGLVAKKSSVSAWLDEPDEPEPQPPSPSPRPSAPPVAEGRATDPMGVPRQLVEVALGQAATGGAATSEPPASQEPPTTVRVSTTPAPSAPPAFVEIAFESPVHDGADGRATSPYGRALPSPAPAGVPASEPAPSSHERTSVAPIVGVGVRKSSLPPAGPRAGGTLSPETSSLLTSSPQSARPPTAGTSTVRGEPLSPIAAPRVPIVEPAPDSTPAPEPPRVSREVAPSRKLRGPLTPAQAAKLLEEADGRDAIVQVFFAFARQFFDYTALFTVAEDRAEGREAFGDGAPSTRVRGLSLSLAEPSLLSAARAALQARLGPLETEADGDLAAVLERPRGAFALVHPVAIKGRVVLLLYADRGGDVFSLADVPELVAFVHRVADALEKLIIRRKREGGGFARAATESRAALKAAVTSLRASARPPGWITGSVDRWVTPADVARSSPVSDTDTQGARSLVDAIAAAGISAAQPEGSVAARSNPGSDALSPSTSPSTPAEPSAPVPTPHVTGAPVSSEGVERGAHEASSDVEAASSLNATPALAPPALPPAEGAYRTIEEIERDTLDLLASAEALSRRTPRRATTVRDMLGIPRAAPPPPTVDVEALLAGGGADRANEIVLGSLAPLAPDVSASSSTEGPSTIPAPPPDANDDEPELVVGDSDDDEPELSIGESVGSDDDDAPDLREETTKPGVLRPKSRVGATSYLVRGSSVEVIERTPRRSQRPASRPPPESASSLPSSDRTTRPLRRHDPRREDDAPTPSDVVPARRSQPRDALDRPSAPPTHDREVPSVIVDMGDSVNTLVENLLHADPQGDTPAVDALLKVGEVALPVLAQSFPGPLWFDRRKPHRRLPRGRDVSAVARAFVAFRERAAPYVGALCGAASAERRFYALMVASEIPAGPLVDPVVQRVFDEDAGVRSLALEVLPKLCAFPEMAEQLVFLRRTARIRGKDPSRRLHALAALGALRDAGALRMLVDLLEDEDARVRQAAHEALVVLCCEDLGDSMRRWAAWADRNEGRHRVEWLMDALLSPDARLRTQAGEELKTITQQYFGFHPALSRKEREVIQAKYRQWWEREGKAAFP
ncbi:MAG: hypothetical protein OHK0013_25400 [Sandaracinaceae bacterium]